RPRHRQGLPRRAAGAALRPPGRGPGAEAGHDLHHRADDQRGHPLHPRAARRLDRGHQGPQALRAVGAHGGRDRGRGRRADAGGRPAATGVSAPGLVDGAGAGIASDADWAAAARGQLSVADARLARRYGPECDMDRLLALRARAVDLLLRQAWARCLPAVSGLAMFAVGGYGRGELFPRSDIDLLVLGEADAQRAHEAALSRFFALVWDVGLPVGHAVRSAAECTAAAADQTVMTALLEARPLVADAAAQAALAAAIAPDRVWPPREFFLAKREELQARHRRFGDTSDNLEPNIKDGPGGLRDLHTLGWMALRAFGVSDLEAVVELGHLGPDEA